MERTVDLCVVGSAASGLFCAVKASQLGVKSILVLEKWGVPSGCSRFAGGIMGFDTPVQKRSGYYYSADQAFQNLIRNLNRHVDAKLVRKWICGSGENILWLEEMGVSLNGSNAWNDQPDLNRHTYHSVIPGGPGQFTGYRIIETLVKKCGEYGIEILCKIPAKHLITDESGRICGVRAETADGEELVVHAKAVTLATGSMGANRVLMREFYHSDEYDDIAIMSSFLFLTGDGVLMADEVGCARGSSSGRTAILGAPARSVAWWSAAPTRSRSTATASVSWTRASAPTANTAGS